MIGKILSTEIHFVLTIYMSNLTCCVANGYRVDVMELCVYCVPVMADSDGNGFGVEIYKPFPPCVTLERSFHIWVAADKI